MNDTYEWHRSRVMMIVTGPHMHSWVRVFIKYRKLSVHPLHMLGEFRGEKNVFPTQHSVLESLHIRIFCNTCPVTKKEIIDVGKAVMGNGESQGKGL